MNMPSKLVFDKFQKEVFEQKYKIRPGMAFRVFDLDTKKSLERSFSSADASDMSKTSFTIKRANTFILISERESNDPNHYVYHKSVCSTCKQSPCVDIPGAPRGTHAGGFAGISHGVIQTIAILEKNNPVFSCLSSDSFSELEKPEILSEPNMNEISKNWLFIPATMSDEEATKKIGFFLYKNDCFKDIT